MLLLILVEPAVPELPSQAYYRAAAFL